MGKSAAMFCLAYSVSLGQWIGAQELPQPTQTASSKASNGIPSRSSRFVFAVRFAHAAAARNSP
jgi:hypothetical protein